MSQVVVPGDAGQRLGARAVRLLPVPAGRVRAEFERVLLQQRFTVTVDQLTLLEAHRDSLLGGPGRQDRPAPLHLRLAFHRDQAQPQRTTVVIDATDRWTLPFAKPVELYRETLTEVFAALDAAAAALIPGPSAFPPVEFSFPTAGAPGAAGAADALGRLTSRASGIARRVLDGSSARSNPRGWRRTGSIVLVHEERQAVLPVENTYALVTAGGLIAQRPGHLPSPLVREVERLVSTLEAALQVEETATQHPVTVDAQGVQATTFLAQQAAIREQLPLRTLYVCTTCRTPRVVNPDYQRLRQRNQRARALTGSLGLAVSPHGASPFVLVGRMMQFNQLEPDFVCARCQGLHAETAMVTFCPRCGEQTAEAALRQCAKCQFDYRGLARIPDPWHPVAAPAPQPAAAPAPTVAAPLPTTQPAPHPPGWYPDYSGRYDHRWFDGERWTTDVASGGVPSVDPLGI